MQEKQMTEADWEKLNKKRQKAPLKQKVYFGLFIVLTVLAAFLFWAVKNAGTDEGVDMGTTMVGAIVVTALAMFFGLLSCVYFLRNRTVAGGLFLTTAFSTAVFLGTSQFIGFLIPPVVYAYTGAGAAGPEAGGLNVVVLLAQIGLFAIWFAFLLFTIKVQVSPIRRVDKCLEKILAGQDIKRIRIGKSRQYKQIEHKLNQLAATMREQKKDCAAEV